MSRTPYGGAFGVIAVILLSACGSHRSSQFAFPQAAGVWKLKHTKELTADQAPEPIRRLGLKRAQSAGYEGAGKLDVQVFELTSSAGALEVEQTWRPAANTVAFHRENYFTVIHWENADRAAVSAFVREMEKLVGR